MRDGASAPVLVVLAVAALVRLLAVFACDRLAADVLRYHRVAAHLLDVSWNPYLAPRLYPYPPVWMLVEAGSEWLARHAGLPFAVLVKLPVVCADVLIVWLLSRWGDEGSPRAAWLYALSPVAILVSSAHGQFDALPLLCLLLALQQRRAGHLDRSALALAAGIGLKSFPVLLLPVLLATLSDSRARARYAALTLVPVAALLLPFAVADAGALGRELLGYGGIADFGWVGALRGWSWLTGGALTPSLARNWPVAVPLSKVLFLAVYVLLLSLFWRERPRLALGQASLAVLLAFSVFYGAQSAQYLLWVVPLGCLLWPRAALAHALAATVGLVGFYLFLAPGVLAPEPGPLPRSAAGALWVIGATATLMVSAAWLAALLRLRSYRAEATA